MPTSAWWRAIASLTPSPRKRDVRAEAALGEDDARLLLGGDAGEDGRRRQQRDEGGVVEFLEVLSGDDCSGVESDLAAEVRCDLAVVAGDDLDRDPEALEPGERCLDVGLDRVGEAEESLEGEVALVVLAQVVDGIGRLATATTRAPEAKRPLRVAFASAGTVVQRARTASGAPLAISIRPCCVSASTDASCRSWSKGRRSSGVGTRSPWAACGAAQSARSSSLPALSLQVRPSRADVVVRLARAVERLHERDLTLGERAGLVREQDLDVAEVLDRDQPLDDHAFLGQTARARREADGDDRRQQLRRQADRDRQCEQGRLEDRASERGVDQEDRAGQQRGHRGEQAREVLQPLLERGHPLLLAQSHRDRAERGARARAHDDAAPAAAAHERAHERARAQIER